MESVLEAPPERQPTRHLTTGHWQLANKKGDPI